MLNLASEPLRLPVSDEASLVVRTNRLVLRPMEEADIKPVAQLATHAVARNLSRMPWPYDEGNARDWLAIQKHERENAEACVFAITGVAGFMGAIGLHVRSGSEVELGYWLGEPFWNKGYASEAARRVCQLAFGEWGLARLVSGHFADNHASGKVLAKTGFLYTHEEPQMSLARGMNVRCLKMRLTAQRFETRERERREAET